MAARKSDEPNSQQHSRPGGKRDENKAEIKERAVRGGGGIARIVPPPLPPPKTTKAAGKARSKGAAIYNSYLKSTQLERDLESCILRMLNSSPTLPRLANQNAPGSPRSPNKFAKTKLAPIPEHQQPQQQQQQTPQTPPRPPVPQRPLPSLPSQTSTPATDETPRREPRSSMAVTASPVMRIVPPATTPQQQQQQQQQPNQQQPEPMILGHHVAHYLQLKSRLLYAEVLRYQAESSLPLPTEKDVGKAGGGKAPSGGAKNGRPPLPPGKAGKAPAVPSAKSAGSTRSVAQMEAEMFGLKVPPPPPPSPAGSRNYGPQGQQRQQPQQPQKQQQPQQQRRDLGRIEEESVYEEPIGGIPPGSVPATAASPGPGAGGKTPNSSKGAKRRF